MDHEEAASVLSHRKDAPAAGLVALAEGWPAVIGLAALTDDFELPEGLCRMRCTSIRRGAVPGRIARGAAGPVSLHSRLRSAKEVTEFLLGRNAERSA